MADYLSITTEVEPVAKMFAHYGDALRGRLLAIAFITAGEVRAGAQAKMRKGRPFTFTNVVIEARSRVDGYVVLMDRKVKDTGSAKAAFWKGTKKRDERHVGKWLEFGTVRMTPKPWLFPAADAQESAYSRRVREALDVTTAEVGG